MSGPLDEGAAPRKALANPQRDDDDSNYHANRERVREVNRRWRAEHLERARQLNRDFMRRARVNHWREAEVRARGRACQTLAGGTPDRVREYQQRWVQENREKVREYYNRYHTNHRDEVSARAAARRDSDPDHATKAAKEWAEHNEERRAELQRTRRSDPETYQSELAANAAARRLKCSLSRAGLPPTRLHPTTAAERRTNQREAAVYFSDPALPEHLRQYTVFAESLTEAHAHERRPCAVRGLQFDRKSACSSASDS